MCISVHAKLELMYNIHSMYSLNHTHTHIYMYMYVHVYRKVGPLT